MGGPLPAGAGAGGAAAASEEADLETELGVCAKAATGGKQQSNSEKEPPQHPIDT